MTYETLHGGNIRLGVGDCRELLRELPEQSIHCCVTSPPYWGLRDYGHGDQIGLESTPEQYIQTMVDVFREVKRALRDDGTLWVNIGDSYAGSWGAQSRGDTYDSSTLDGLGEHYISARQIKAAKKQTHTGSLKNTPGIKAKDLVGIPWMLAFALRADGWYLRQDNIWSKPAPMPESVQDRCTKAHEYVFLLTKSPRYYYDIEAIKEPAATGHNGSSFTSGKTVHGKTRVGLAPRADSDNRNKRSVWTVDDKQQLQAWLAKNHPAIAAEFQQQAAIKSDVWTVTTDPYKGAHFATYPPKLIEPCILAGSPETCCGDCGAGYVRIVERDRVATRPGTDSKVNRASSKDDSPYNGHSGMVVGNRDPQRHTTTTKTVGFESACQCNTASAKSVVLDPFGGSGTTGAVSIALGRDAVLTELNAEYADLIRKRLGATQPVMF